MVFLYLNRPPPARGTRATRGAPSSIAATPIETEGKAMTISVSVNGVPKFIWNGDAVDILVEVPKWIRNAGKIPIEHANQCITQLGTGYFDKTDEARQRGMISALVWRIMTSDAHPEFGIDLMTGQNRTIGECLPFFDYDVDFHITSDGYDMHITAQPKD
jgi:hypothetical protein